MTPRDFERELVRATGESVETIRSRGFSLIEPPELKPLVVDWDQLQAERSILPGRRSLAGTG